MKPTILSILIGIICGLVSVRFLEGSWGNLAVRDFKGAPDKLPGFFLYDIGGRIKKNQS